MKGDKKYVAPTRITMQVVRAWDGGSFVYQTIYSDGQVKPATKKDAEKYERAYGLKVQTVMVHKPNTAES